MGCLDEAVPMVNGDQDGVVIEFFHLVISLSPAEYAGNKNKQTDHQSAFQWETVN